MRKQDFGPQLNRELYQAFKRIFITSKDPANIQEIYERVAQSPASRFYVSEEEAMRNVRRLVAHKGACMLSPLRQALYTEIAFRALCRHEQTGHPLNRCVAEVVNEPAPRFYLTPMTIKYKICQYRRELREKRVEK